MVMLARAAQSVTEVTSLVADGPNGWRHTDLGEAFSIADGGR